MLLFALFGTLSASAAEAYAVYTSNNTTLTFYYDNQRSSRTGTKYDLNTGDNVPGWYPDSTCHSVTKVVFNNTFANARPTSTRYWFCGMSGLTSITGIGNLNTSKVTDMSQMFSFCSSLTSLDLSNFNTTNVTNMWWMFYGCSSLTTIYVGEGWSTENVTSNHNYDKMFFGCTSLVGGHGTKYSENYVSILYACIDGGMFDRGYFSSKNPIEAYAMISNNNTKLTFYYDSQWSSHPGTYIPLNKGNNTPYWYDNLWSETIITVEFDPSFADARPTSTYFWFAGMGILETIIGIEYLNTSNVTSSWSRMFLNCLKLTSLDLSGFDTKNVTSMGGMFYNCSSLTTLDLSGWDTSNVTDMNSLFDGCSSITDLDLSSFNTSKVTKMNSMFFGCSSLTSIYVGSGWNTKNVSSSGNMFDDCTALVGGNGTTYDENHIDKEYARIDVVGNPGYLTDISARQPYAVLSDNNTKLTFYYDGLRSLRTGTDYNLNPDGTIPGWDGNSTSTSVTTVVFDPSFADARPTTTYSWFCGMKNLTTISGMQYLNTSKVTDMHFMFAFCEKLTSLDLSNFNTANVTNMFDMFESCKALSSLDLSNFNTGNVTTMGEMFRECSSLESLSVSNWNTDKVTEMRYMFEECGKLTTLDLSNWNTDNVTDMRSMFAECSKLETIIVGSQWSTTNVTKHDYMFGGCSSLVGGSGTAFDVDHIDKEYAHVDYGTRDPGYLTSYMSFDAEPYAVLSSNKTTLTFYYDNQKAYRQGTKYSLEKNPEYGWYHNNNIKTVEFHELFANYHGLTSTGGMFDGLKNLEQINHLDRLNTENVTDMSGMFRGCSKLTSLNLFYFDTSNVTYMTEMFRDCSSLISLSLSSYFNTLNVTDMKRMFNGCSSLRKLDLYSFDTSKVKDMSAMFRGCNSLETITNMHFNTANVTAMNYMFADCRSLTSLSVSSFNVQKVTSMRSMFEGCSSLETLNFGNFYTSNVTNMGNMFNGCSSLTSIELRTFDTSKVTLMSNMFRNCSSLENLDLSYLNTENVYNMSGMFDGCGCPTLDVTGFNTSKVVNTESMFANISATSLNLLNFDMSKVEYCSKMFAGASNLTTIYCEDTWECSHADSVFVGCTSLEGAISYNPAKISGDYANPVTGYFSSKSYAVLSEDGKTLTFYHDGDKQTRPGTKYVLKDYPDWYRTGTNANVTSVVFDGSFYYARPTNTSYWFRGMANLETITGLRNLNTSQVTDMSYMFMDCSKLTTLDLSRFNTEKVTTMLLMFKGMSTITMLNLGAFKPLNVTDMRNMFEDDIQLTTIYVSSNNWTTESVTDIANMFKKCTSLVGGAGTTYSPNHPHADYAIIDGTDGKPGYLTEKKDPYAVQSPDKKTLTFYYDYMKDSREGKVYEVPMVLTDNWGGNDDITTIDFDESFADYDGLTSTSIMFGSMTALTEINHFERMNTENVENMSWMFSGCSALTTLDLSGFNTKKVKQMSNMFNECSSLTTIYVGAGWDVSQVTSSNNMFSGCTKIKGSNGTTYDADRIDKEYARIDGLNGQPGYLSAALETYVVYTSSNSTLTFYYDSERSTRSGIIYDMNTGSNEPDWYIHSQVTTTVVFDPSFADARPTTTYGWFMEMENLTTITGLEYLNTSKVINMGHMFDSCYLLNELDVSHFDTGNVTCMESMFDGLSGLSKLDLSSFNTSKVTDMSYMFYRCTNLTSLDLTNFNTENVKNMYGMFGSCTYLTTIIVGKDWSTAKVTSSDNMFLDSKKLEGGAGTKYDASKVDKTYACVDGLNGQPGYLTAAPYAVISEDFTTLTFYNDGFNHLNDGITCYLNKANQTPGWLSYRDVLTNVVFDSSFANVRPTTMFAWFSGMGNLTTFTGMENLNTSEVKNMSMTFASCNSLTTLDLSNWNTAKVTDMTFMFNGSGYLTTVYVGRLWSIANPGLLSYDMFTACGSIMGQNGTTYNPSVVDKTYARIDVDGQPGYFSAKAEAYAVYTEDNTTLTFYYDNLRITRAGTIFDLNEDYHVDAGWQEDIDTEDVTSVVFDPSFANARPTTTYSWFYGMTNLNTITGMENLNTSEVFDMAYMFENCNALTTLDLSNFDTSKVTDMEGMFANGNNLTTLDLSSFNTANVVNMKRMFADREYLTTIYVSEGWSTAKVTSSDGMFSSCLDIEGGNGTRYSNDHLDANYAHIDVAGNPGYFTEAPTEPYAVVSTDGKTLTFYYDNMKGQRQGTKYEVPNGEYAPEWYWNNASPNIETVVFDPSFAEVRPHSTYGWFELMGNLSTITGLEYLNTSEVTNMSMMFMGCGSLTSLDLSDFDTKNVTNMEAMFRFCGSLVTIEVGDKWSTANVTWSDIMFEYCTSIEGGKGTRYDEAHVDGEYAHVDGGPSNPGYFTYKATFMRGDVNGDNKVDVADITALTNYLKGTTGSYNLSAADVDGNGEVTSADVPALVNKILGK